MNVIQATTVMVQLTREQCRLLFDAYGTIVPIEHYTTKDARGDRPAGDETT